MKRLIAIVVSAVMIFVMTSAVFAAPAEVTWEDYQQYLIDTAGVNAPDLQEFTDQVKAIGSWEDIDQTVSPWDQFFTTLGLSTWEEFQAGEVKELAAIGAMGGPGGDSPEGESPEGESPAPPADGESPEGESPAPPAEGESPEGESAGGPPSGTKQSISELKVSSFATNDNDKSRPQDEGHIYVGYAITDGQLDADNSNWEGDIANIALDNVVEGEGFTAIRAEGDTTVSVTGNLVLQDDSDGQFVSDFTGTGVGITGANGAKIYADNMMYLSTGFARSFAIIQNGTLVLTNSDITALGRNPLTDAWDGYYNSANTSMMISPPWVLGIQGGIRALNVLGSNSTLVVADSTVTAGGWGVLSTDGCQQPSLHLYNSTLNILPESEGGMNSGWAILGYDENAYGSGYGSYIIGSAQEYFKGMTINGATYASILTGGDAYYDCLIADETYQATAPDGTVIGAYTAKEDVPTTINTVFGFMAHNSGSMNILNGTVVNTAAATALYKSADSVWTFDDAELHPGSGIIFQMIDNDDSTVGGFNPFGTYLKEEAGFPKDAYADAVAYVFTTDTKVDPAKTYYTSDTDDASGYAVVENPTDAGTVAYYEKSTGGNQVTVNFKNHLYDGDLYNATGYYNQASDALTVNIDVSATLQGDIALASHVHGIWLNGRPVDDVIAAIDAANAYHANIGGYYEGLEDIEYVFLDAEGAVTEDKDAAAAIQFTKFSTAEYYLLGQVLNMINNNGLATIDVNVDGVWYPQRASLVTYLKVAEGAHVYGTVTELEDGSVLITPSEETVKPGEYGSAFIYVEGPGSGGGPGGGESPEGESPEGESPEGQAPEGESAEAPAPPAEGESPEGQAPEGESPAPPAEGESPEGEAPAAPAAEAPAAEAPAADDELYAAFVEYIHEWLLNEEANNEQMTLDVVENEFMPLVKAGDFESFPADMLYNGMLETGSPMTFEEFAASQK